MADGLAAIDSLDISMNEEETMLFVDLWEQFPCLWNCRDKQYKDRNARQTALKEIADSFGRNWTTGAVLRKIDSLKAYYRRAKKKASGSTGSPGGTKKVWPFLERIHSFFGQTIYNGSTVTGSQCPGDDSQVLSIQEQDSPRDLHSSGTSSSSCDVDSPCSSNTPPSEPLPLPKKRKLGNRFSVNADHTASQSARSEFHEAAVGFLRRMEESRKHENPEMAFSVTVADRLNSIKSERRRILLKHKIECLIHEALMEELPDN